MIKKDKIMSRDEFSAILFSSLYSTENFNSHMEKLGITVKPFIGYEYYIGDKFICSTDDLCVDDLLEKAGFKIEEYEN